MKSVKWRYYPVPIGDERAKHHIVESLSTGSHTLTQKLLRHFAAADGPIFAIAMEGIDVEKITGYRYEQCHFEQNSKEFWNAVHIPNAGWAIDGLVSFLFDHLAKVPRGLIVIDDLIGKSTDQNQSSEVREACNITSQRAFFNDEVMYLVIPEMSHDAAKETIRGADMWWLNGVCTAEVAIPESDRWSDRFLDEVVARTTYIFVAAFDGEGYLVWEPHF